MQVLYSGSGAGDMEILQEHFAPEEGRQFRALLARLLMSRDAQGPLKLLDRLQWTIVDGTNIFQDEFCVLYARLSLDQYVEHAALVGNTAARKAAAELASTIREIGPFVRHVAFELDTDVGPEPVASPEPQFTSSLVDRALSDAEQLIRTGGAISAVDRVHTALHGYLRVVLDKAGIAFDEQDTLTALLKRLSAEHSAFARSDPHAAHTQKVLRSAAAIFDALGPIRNRASVAHANETLLDEPEAMLVINVARSILHYVDAKLTAV
jgi:hypothetical protein